MTELAGLVVCLQCLPQQKILQLDSLLGIHDNHDIQFDLAVSNLTWHVACWQPIPHNREPQAQLMRQPCQVVSGTNGPRADEQCNTPQNIIHQDESRWQQHANLAHTNSGYFGGYAHQLRDSRFADAPTIQLPTGTGQHSDRMPQDGQECEQTSTLVSSLMLQSLDAAYTGCRPGPERSDQQPSTLETRSESECVVGNNAHIILLLQGTHETTAS